MLSAFCRALLFLVQQALGKSLAVSSREKIIGRFLCDIYEPKDRKTQGTIVFVHGMTLMGSRDPRQIMVCRSLAGAGYLVVAPFFQEISKTSITEKSIENIVESSLEILKDPNLAKKEKIAFFAPSFSAALVIRAASSRSLQDKISAICSVGTFAHVDHVIEYALQHETGDEYARLIILKNFVELSTGKNPALRRALELKIADNWHRRQEKEQEFPQYLKKLKPKDKKLVLSLIEDRQTAAYHFRRFLPKIKNLSQAINPVLALDKLKAALLLLHGKYDPVIPPTESSFLYTELEARKKPVKLCITSFISHGDNKISLSQVREILRVWSAFAWYFYRV
ncbi:MAG: hypothetical protein NZM25_01925 [Leptospiraceae bacterium]|nr:hypothetical protein [Leptospiraceae bacterium]MDW8306934.1 hypothetical protein [Leptospiraceae bacterium]